MIYQYFWRARLAVQLIKRVILDQEKGHRMRSDAPCSILFYLSASEKFTETLGFYDSVVGEPELFILTGKLGVGAGLEGVLDEGGTDLIPDIHGIEQPGDRSR